MRQWLRNRIVALLDNFLGVGVMALAAALLPLSLITRASVVVGLLLGLYLLTEVKSIRFPLGLLRHACGQLLFRMKLALALYRSEMRLVPSFPLGMESMPGPHEGRAVYGLPPLVEEPVPPEASEVDFESIPYLELAVADGGQLVSMSAAEGIARRSSVQKSHMIGRNDPCWCGGAKKYKKCHGA